MDIIGKYENARVLKYLTGKLATHECMVCGTIFTSTVRKSRPVKSCGCLVGSRSHGDTSKGKKSVEYTTWQMMRQRCNNPNAQMYSRYGGRGITCCSRWNKFVNFLADMGRRPSTDHSIDRIDNNGNYEPGNCKWSTRSEQMNNRRVCNYIEYNGKTMTALQWFRELHVSGATFYRQIKKGLTSTQIFDKYKK